MRSEGFLVFKQGFGEGAWPRRPVTEPKRSQKPKALPLPRRGQGARYIISGNALRVSASPDMRKCGTDVFKVGRPLRWAPFPIFVPVRKDCPSGKTARPERLPVRKDKKYFPKNAGISEQCRKMVQNAAKNSMTFAAFCAATPHEPRTASVGLPRTIIVGGSALDQPRAAPMKQKSFQQVLAGVRICYYANLSVCKPRRCFPVH